MTTQPVNLIEQLFAPISLNQQMPSDLKLLLMRLLPAFQKLSMRDSYLGINKQHPARMTLKIASQFAQPVQRTPGLIIHCEEIIDALLASRLCSTDFSAANHKLRSLLQKHTQPLSQTADSNAWMLDTQQAVDSKLEFYLQGRKIPDSCHQLVFQLWPQALCHLFTAYGEFSPEWYEAIEIYCELIDSLQPIENMDQYRQLRNHYMSTVKHNNNFLLLYHQEQQVEETIKSLIQHYNQVLRQSSYGEATQNMKTICSHSPGTNHDSTG